MKLSVAIITYNHEKYIRQAIESVLQQKVHFKYEIVIGEDCSSDKTRDIVIEYQRKYPHLIRLLLPKNNLGMNKNFISTIDSCRGEYIAYLEGDDYWTSKDKLQTQVDLLESNPDYKFCFHLVAQVFENKKEEKKNMLMPAEPYRRELVFDDLLPVNFIGTCSVVFRNGLIKKWPKWMYKIKMMDWPLYLLLLQNGGRAGFIDRVMAVYRRHEEGVLSGADDIENYYNAIEALNIYNKYFSYKNKEVINSSIYRFYCFIALDYYTRNHVFLFLRTLLKILKFKIWRSPFVRLNRNKNWNLFNEILAREPRKSNFVNKIFIKYLRLINSFIFSVKTTGISTSLLKVLYYVFRSKKIYNSRQNR